MIESLNAPWFLRWFDLVTIGAGFIALIVIMLLLAPVFTGSAHDKQSAPPSLRR
jgi:hypothetical protein